MPVLILGDGGQGCVCANIRKGEAEQRGLLGSGIELDQKEKNTGREQRKETWP